jgi:SulP family sulfate permease
MVNKSNRAFPFLEGVLPIDRKQVPLDILAGITLAALAIPEVMGYTKIAGMPVVTGLYTILFPMALFALFGSSRHLVVGADSATAAIMAAGLAGLAATASTQYVAYAGISALIAAGLLILARIIKFGFISDFLSRTVLIGFLTGVGIQVSLSQFSGMLGIECGAQAQIIKLTACFNQLGQINRYTLVISILVLGIIVGGRRINKKIPGTLIAVIGSILASYWMNLSAYRVSLVGMVPGGLPGFGLPKGVSLDLNTFETLLPVSLSMFVVILAQSAATSRAYATRYHESFSESVDLLGLGLANIGAGLTGTFIVNGSPTKTQMVDSAGGRTQLAALITSLVTAFVLLFLTKPLEYLPEAVLSAVVFLIGVELVDYKGMHEILRQRPVEFWVATITAAVVVFIGVEQGILLAILLSIAIHTRHGYKPKNGVIAIDSAGEPHIAPLNSHAQAAPGLVIYRFHHGMYYANAELFSEEVLELVNTAQPPLQWFCLDAVAVDDIDFSAAEALRGTFFNLKAKNIRLVLAEIGEPVRMQLDRSRLVDLFGEDSFFETVTDVQEAYGLTALVKPGVAR